MRSIEVYKVCVGPAGVQDSARSPEVLLCRNTFYLYFWHDLFFLVSTLLFPLSGTQTPLLPPKPLPDLSPILPGIQSSLVDSSTLILRVTLLPTTWRSVPFSTGGSGSQTSDTPLPFTGPHRDGHPFTTLELSTGSCLELLSPDYLKVPTSTSPKPLETDSRKW